MQDKGVYSVGSIGIESALGTNKVLKNTYMLLGMTLLFSAFTAGVSMAIGLGQGMALILTLVGFGLLFVVHKMADTSKGLLAIFAFTGVMGAAIGPMLNYYLAMPGGFLMVGLLVAVVAMIANIFLAIPALSLTISAAIVMIMSGLILFDTSRIINGGETNYIRATVSLYLDIYNLFIHLLSLLTAFSGDD